MENGNFGRPGPRLDPPGKKIGGGPKAQGVSKPGEFNTLILRKLRKGPGVSQFEEWCIFLIFLEAHSAVT